MSLLGSSFIKKDRYGQALTPGCVCILWRRKGGPQFCVYKGGTRASTATGKFGRFIIDSGEVSVKYDNVIFVFEPTSERRANTEIITNLTRRYYEGN